METKIYTSTSMTWYIQIGTMVDVVCRDEKVSLKKISLSWPHLSLEIFVETDIFMMGPTDT